MIEYGRDYTDDRGEPLPGWEDPLPIGWPAKLPPFPVDALPGVVGDYAGALAVETQTPVDLPGAVVLGGLAACIGGRVRVRVRRGWSEPTNLYVVPVLAPGARKSAVVSACEAPLDNAEKQLIAELTPLIREAAVDREIREKYAEQAKNKASKNPDLALLVEAQEAVRAAAEVVVPAYPRLLTDDATPEQFVKLLGDQGGRIAAITAEAGVFDSLIGRYATRTNLDPILKAHAGDSIRVDRRSREPERVDRPALTMIASIQPYALREMVSRPEFGGRGLLARVLWALPPDKVGYRDADAPAASEDLVDSYRLLVEALAVSMAKREDVVHLELTESALKALLEYMRQVEVMLRADGPLGRQRLTREWGSKLVGAVARIAGCLHVAGTRNALVTPIAEKTMSDAIRVGEYFRAHGIAALTPTDDERVTADRNVVALLVDKGMHTFTVRELQRRVPRSLQEAKQLREILDRLSNGGWVRLSNGGGYELHPDAARHLKTADSADSADTDYISAGQDAQGGVSTDADTADSAASDLASVSTVSDPADTSADALTSGNTPPVSAVSAVSSDTASSADCPSCGWPYDSAGHATNCIGAST